ncbi:hypothetical protein [Teichococcus aestuarii]|uniref:hypothetical protein n=1 Tax=Teichococcus aestuarii TaxID=568898 RepID=UPI0036202A43
MLSGATPPLIVDTDQQRPGAAAQLVGVAALLRAPLSHAASPAAALQAVALRPPGGVLIDTPGTDPFDPEQARALLALIQATRAHVALVLPAGLDSAEAADLARAFRALGATHMIPTRLDATRRMGAALRRRRRQPGHRRGRRRQPPGRRPAAALARLDGGAPAPPHPCRPTRLYGRPSARRDGGAQRPVPCPCHASGRRLRMMIEPRAAFSPEPPLPEPLLPEPLLPEPLLPPGRIVAVASGKGGVGKTGFPSPWPRRWPGAACRCCWWTPISASPMSMCSLACSRSGTCTGC